MDKKYFGFAVVAVLGLVACHNIFNKDKAIVVRDTTSVTNTETSTSDTAIAQSRSASQDSNLRYVYLTFDDGPDAGTLNCYNTCKSKGVKATFFLVGEHANLKPGKKIIDTMKKDMRHFLFANHSYTHAGHNRYEGFYSKPNTALDDFLKVHDSLQLEKPIARFPGNNVWVVENTTRTTKLTRPLSKLMDSIGYDVLGWDVEWHFNRKNEPIQSAEAMAEEVINAVEAKTSLVKNHVVLLAHDRMFKEANYKDSLAKMISIIQAKKGYIFETADQYPKIRKNDKSLIAARK
jgi:peptidoglycan-N-acetylglucosamine deacetylase